MSEFFMVVKTALFSVLVLMVLQMKWSGTTLEKHSEEWIYESRAGAQLQTVASGAVKAGREGWDWAVAKVREATDTRSTESSRPRRTETRSNDLD